jgi:hypothetical protein
MDYDIQELAGGISMDAVMLRVRHSLIYPNGWEGFHFAEMRSTSDEIESGEHVKFKIDDDGDIWNMEYPQKDFNSFVDRGDIEVYVRNQ